MLLFLFLTSCLGYSSQAKVAAKTIKATLKRRDTAERFLSLPGFSEHGFGDASESLENSNLLALFTEILMFPLKHGMIRYLIE